MQVELELTAKTILSCNTNVSQHPAFDCNDITSHFSSYTFARDDLYIGKGPG